MDEPINDNFDKHAGHKDSASGKRHPGEETCSALRKRVLDLEASESYLRAIFDSVNDAILVHDATTGAILDVNQCACKMWGYTRDRMLQLSVGDLSCGEHPYTQEHALQVIREAAGGEPQLVEWRCKDKNGNLFWVEVNMRRTVSTEDNRLLAVARDITERKRIQEALQASYERLQLAQEAAKIGIFEWRTETGVSAWSPEVEALYGLAPGTFEGTLDDWLKRIHPEDRKMAANDVADAMKTGLHHVAFRVIWPDGSIHWLEARGRVYFDEQGNPVRMLGMNIDITERKRAEEALRESEKRYRDVVELIPAGIVVHSDFTILYVNPASVAAAQVSSADDMVGRPIWDFIAPDWRETYRKRYIELLKSHDRTVLTEGVLMDSKGNRVIVEGTARVIEFAGKTAILSTFRDITKRKLAEEALWKSQRTLSHVMNTVPQSIFWKDRNSVYLGCNEVFARAIGLTSPEEIVGKTDRDLPWPKEEADAYLADDREVMDGDQPKRHIIEPLQQADGSRLWIDTTKIPMHDEHGKVIGILGVYEDITERRLTEDALARRSRQLEILSNTSRKLNTVLEIPVVMRTLIASAMELVEAEGGSAGLLIGERIVFTEYNSRGAIIPIDYVFERGVGVPGYVMQTRAPYTTEDAESDPHVVPGVRKALGFITLIDVPILSRDGELLGCFELHNKTRRRSFDENDVAMLEGLAASAAVALENAQVLADRRQAQDELQQSTQMLKLVLDNIPAWVFWKDRNSIYMGCNYLFAANAGLASSEDIIGKSDFDLPWTRAEAESYRADDQQVMETGIPKLNYEETQKTADGRTMWLRTSKIPLRGPKGDVVGILGTFENITERKRIDQEKRAFYRQTILAATSGKLEICDQDDVEPFVADGEQRYDVCLPSDAGEARREVESFFRASGLAEEALGMFMIAVGEAITNAVKHAPRGCVVTGKTDDEVWVAIADNGPGIESLILPSAVLWRGFSTKPSLGLGYSIMLDVADRIMLKTDAGGTTVILFKRVHPISPSLELVPDTWEGMHHSI